MAEAVSPPKRPTAQPWILGGAALVITLTAGIAIGGVAASNGDQAASVSSSTSAAPSSPAATKTAATHTAAPTTAAPAFHTPTTKDFKLGVKILRKQCFGSAGCNINYRIDVTYLGGELDPSKTYEITYEVTGAEDPIINTLEVTGDSASVQEEESAGTKRSSDKLTAVVADISES